MTDEELKQQYGIHLTSRIQEDGDGKEAKWADIDDDEDDWAPETIEWNDGTKSTLTPADIAPPPTQKSMASAEMNDEAKPTQPPKVLPPQFTSSVGPNATVLKLGASAERQQAQKGATLQSRGPSEKPTLSTSKANLAPTPAKSPWATLPPVDKVSPISINPQQSMPPPSRFPQSGSYSQSPSALTAPSPAKEISADDFNRSWRESSPGQTRELYMPSSGKYEAVPESRRRMSRNDQNFRAAAVLQRPSHTDMHAPAEPSAAFQTNRTSMDSARRRASSTISGGSGQFGRRMSIKSSEHATPVFDTHKMAIEVDAPPSSADGTISQTQTPTYQARGTNDYISAGSVSATEADIEAQRTQQKALMKENIERARKRKIEEEQRMEAEKQERIRAKLASLGPNTITSKADENTHDSVPKKITEQTVAPAANAATTTQSPPKPPQPLASGEPQQYGMMKVHPLDSIKKLGTSLSRPVDSHKTIPPVKVEPNLSKDQQVESNQGPSPIVNGVRAVAEPRHPGNQEVVSPPEPSPKFPKHTSGSDARSGWNDLRHDHRGPQTSNLWGVPNLNNKALGNGTFDQTLAGYAPQDLSRTSSTAQGWMNGRTPHAGRSPQTQHVNHTLPDSRSYSFQSVTSPDQGPLAVDSEIDSLLPTTKPTPIAPPQSQHVHPSMNGHQNGSRPTGLDAWGNFHAVASQQERSESEKIQREIAARREEELRTGIRQGPQYSFNETWKQVQVGDQAGQRQLANVSQTTVPPSTVFGAVGSLSNADPLPRIGSGQAGRGSRFFPQHLGNQQPQDRRAFTYSHPEPPRTPSPPPAEEYASLHPAFDGDFARPVVHFPREKAVVKLPPAMPPTPPSPAQVQPEVAPQPESHTPLTWAARVSMPPPATAAPLRSVSTPIVQNPSWQERFNGLLGRKSSPAKEPARLAGPALAVASFTKEPLDVQHVSIPAASVSLPIQIEVEADFTFEDELVMTKDVESEDDLFEDREPGSLPAINFPRDTLPSQWAPTTTSRILPLPVEPTSTAAFMVSNLFERHNGPQKSQFAIIRIPGSIKSIKKDIPLKGPLSNPGSRQKFGSGPPSSSGSYSGRNPRHRANPRSRQTSKAH